MIDQNRMQWAARRGMLELDLFILPFVKQRFSGLSSAEQEQFEKLLGCSDQELFNWLKGTEICPDKEFSHLIRMIQDHAKTRDLSQPVE